LKLRVKRFKEIYIYNIEKTIMVMTTAEKSRRYREKNPERYRESLRRWGNKTWVCECGMEMKNQYRTHHIRTQKHEDKMEILRLKEELETLKQV